MESRLAVPNRASSACPGKKLALGLGPRSETGLPVRTRAKLNSLAPARRGAMPAAYIGAAAHGEGPLSRSVAPARPRLQRDQGGAGTDGSASRHGSARLAAGEYRGIGQTLRGPLLRRGRTTDER